MDTIQTDFSIREFMPEGLTRIYEAPQRYGKTLMGTIEAVDAFNSGRTVFSTIPFAFKHEKLKFTDLVLSEDNPFYGGHIFIDELNFFFDCRSSMTKLNKQFAAMLLQTKKQGCNLTGTTHNINYLDIRFRHNYDYRLLTEVFPKYPSVPEILKVVVESGPLQKKYRKVARIKCKPFLKLYDTTNVYNPFEGIEEKNANKKTSFAI